MSALQRIFRKYIQQNVSHEEKELVEGWYASYEELPLPEITPGEEQLIRTRLWNRLAAQLQLQQAAPALPGSGNTATRRYWRHYGVAAAVVGIVVSLAGLIAYYKGNKPPAQDFTDIHTRSGEWKRILLPDSSIIKLAPNSFVRFEKPFDGPSREILVSQGEAWYDVAHDSRRPFIIHSGQLTIRVLGTSFNVSNIRGTQEQSVLVKRGRVQVQQEGSVLGILTAGTQLVFDTTSRRFRISKNKDLLAERVEQGWLVLDNVSWPVMQAMVSSRYNATLIDRHHKMESAFFTASFKPGTSLPDVMQVLCSIHSVKFEIKGDQVIIN